MHAHAVVPPLRRANPLHVVRDSLALLERFPLSLVLLMSRVAVGTVFLKSGLVKIASWTATVQLFAFEYRVPLLPPEFAATLAASIELTAPVLLFVGFGSRFAAAAMLGMTIVIQVFVYPTHWTEHLMWASLLTLVLTRGAGMFAIDHWLARRVLGGGR